MRAWRLIGVALVVGAWLLLLTYVWSLCLANPYPPA